METFNVVSIVPLAHLSQLLKYFEARQIPYNVELSKVKQPIVKQTNGQTNKALVLDLLSKKALSIAQIGDAFVAAGRKRSSCYGPLHILKKDKVVDSKKGGIYALTLKGVK